jgi:hypothetical protein
VYLALSYKIVGPYCSPYLPFKPSLPRRSIKKAQKFAQNKEVEDCYFSPNLSVKSLEIVDKMGLSQLTERIPKLLKAKEAYLEYQRMIKIEVI